ncbi:MAG: hypothetical protein ABSA23_16010 [Anaerolineales bacterium]
MKPNARITSSLMLIVLFASLLLSCSIFTGASPTTATPSGAGTPVSNTQPTLGPGTKVTPELDNKDLVDALIPAKGGQVILTLPSGVAYNLNIPKGALLNDQEISMVPITRIDGMRLSGGLIGGVQLEPEGLELLTPATLTITVPKGYDPKQMVGFGYHGEGDGFHLDLASGDGKTITLPIFSFSGHGAASGTPGSIANQADQPVASPADAYAQQLTNAVKQCVGQDDSQCVSLIQMIIDQYNDKIQPALSDAQNNDNLIDSAAGAFLQWLHGVELLGLDRVITINRNTYDFPALIDKGLHMVFKGTRNAFDQESNRCINMDDISQSRKMATRLQQLALLSDDYQPPYDLQTKWKDFEACVRYTLIFKSHLVWKMGDSMTITADLVGTAVLRLDGQDEYFLYSTRNGDGTLKYDGFEAEFSGASAALNNYCKIDATDSGGKMQVAMRPVGRSTVTDEWILSPIVAIKPTAMDQHLPKWDCSTGASGATINMTETAELPLWEAGFYDLHKNLPNWEYENNGFTITAPYWFGGFTNGDGVDDLGVLQWHTTTETQGSTVEEDLSIHIIAAPGATQ